MKSDIMKAREAVLGNWERIAPEVRPSANRKPDGSLKPCYFKPAFKCQPCDRFELEIVNSAGLYGVVPLVRVNIGRYMFRQGPHPIALGAQKVDFVADETYEVTPLAQQFADVFNKVASAEYTPLAIDSPQSTFARPLPRSVSTKIRTL